MAKGSIGNLFQHFVALTCASRLIDAWGRPNDPIEYVDCYSMAPWEEITGMNDQGFSDEVQRFNHPSGNGDFVAKVFLECWAARYRSLLQMPTTPRNRVYPNTALLLASGFPKEQWAMRLHDKEKKIQLKLRQWAQTQANVTADIAGNWTESNFLRRRPADPDRPLLLMLDPYKVRPEADTEQEGARTIENGYLPLNWLRGLLGGPFLNLIKQVEEGRSPFVITLFTYADTASNALDGPIRGFFQKQFGRDCYVEQVNSGPHNGLPPDQFHRGWICSFGLPTPLVQPNMQAAWVNWL